MAEEKNLSDAILDARRAEEVYGIAKAHSNAARKKYLDDPAVVELFAALRKEQERYDLPALDKVEAECGRDSARAWALVDRLCPDFDME